MAKHVAQKVKPAIDTTVEHDQISLTDFDLHLWGEGTFYRSYKKLGAHVTTFNGEHGTRFSLWAPNAHRVSVIGDFNGWRSGETTLAACGQSGLWSGFISGVSRGALYKFVIDSNVSGFVAEKADPFAFYAEVAPRSASIVWQSEHTWSDHEWLSSRARHNSLSAPMSVYEVHLGSWMKVPEEGNRWMTYRELAHRLTDYVIDMGYTHIELMPILEYPFGGSWGYQVLSYFAPTSRYGTPDDFKYFVDMFHQRGIGVLMDWVPAHFPADPHGLAVFDGTHLFEHSDPRQRDHPDWGTFIFNYGRNEVSNFLISSALYWLDEFHIDGLRVDAVASMLYLDYSRKEGDWISNKYGGRENIEAIQFLRKLNEVVYTEYPEVVMSAEESTSWPMVSRPTYVGGLGFGLKWNMGWMHDSLDYMHHDPVHRAYHHNNLTFGMLYAFHENFVLPFSHDEVVHGKGSMYSKMPGDHWQKLANLRSLYGYQYAFPGKKLLFMGSEFGQHKEWDHDQSLDWHLLWNSEHAGLRQWVKDLNQIYRREPALYELDFEPSGFHWVDCNDNQQSVLSLLRFPRGEASPVLVMFNFTPIPRHYYRVGVPYGGYWEEILNSDSSHYGGSGIGNLGGCSADAEASHGMPYSLAVTLPPLSALFFRLMK